MRNPPLLRSQLDAVRRVAISIDRLTDRLGARVVPGCLIQDKSSRLKVLPIFSDDKS
jgi:hypothetical protein